MNRRMRHNVLVGLLALISAAFVGCGWEPSARPVQPELLAQGAYEVIGMLDIARYAGFVRDPQTDPRVGILDLRTRKRCELPEGSVPLSQVISGPRNEDHPPFLWPAARLNKNGMRTLTFSDEQCEMRELDAPVGDAIFPVTLDADQRAVILFGDGKGKLSIYDPWDDDLSVIATGVGRFVQAQRPQSNGSPVGPQMLWLIEKGVLTLRMFDGTKIVARGKAVTELTQAALATLRVAYVDNGDLYEAVAPDFKPALLGQDACTPFYGGTTISFFSPCEARQLNRIDLTTGTLETFAPGVYAEWKQDGFSFERAIDEEGANSLFVTPPNGTRTLVTPTLVSDVQVLDRTRVVGRTAQNDFGIWALEGKFEPILRAAGRVVAFIDTRTMRLSWVALHELDKGTATLSYLEQPNFRIETIARKVAPNSVAVLQLVPIAEPVLVYVRDATVTQVEGAGARYSGSLDARVLSGDLKSNISADVTSYVPVADPNVPGLLYATDGPKDKGLWFAAL